MALPPHVLLAMNRSKGEIKRQNKRDISRAIGTVSPIASTAAGLVSAYNDSSYNPSVGLGAAAGAVQGGASALSAGAGIFGALGFGALGAVTGAMTSLNQKEKMYEQEENRMNNKLYSSLVGNDIGLQEIIEAKKGGQIMPSEDSENPELETYIPIQTEVDEMMLFADGSLQEVNATKKHKDMKKDKVTDVVPVGTYIFPESVKLTNKDLELLITYSVGDYSENGKNFNIDEVRLTNILGKKFSGSFADAARIIKRKYPVTSDKRGLSGIIDKSNDENMKNRLTYLNHLIRLNEAKLNKTKLEENKITPSMTAKKGGYVSKYPEGGTVGDPPNKKKQVLSNLPTTQDSLNVYNNSVENTKYYTNNKRFKISPYRKSITSNEDISNLFNLVSMPNMRKSFNDSSKELYKTSKGKVGSPEGRLAVVDKNTIELGAVFHGMPSSLYQKDAPKILLNKGIKPKSWEQYANYGDGTRMSIDDWNKTDMSLNDVPSYDNSLIVPEFLAKKVLSLKELSRRRKAQGREIPSATKNVVSQSKQKPIYVTDPNDPRLKSYQDSLSLSKMSDELTKKVFGNKKIENRPLKENDKDTYRDYMKVTDVIEGARDLSDKIVNKSKKTGIKPTSINVSDEDTLTLSFKNPVKPYFLEKRPNVSVEGIQTGIKPVEYDNKPDMNMQISQKAGFLKDGESKRPWESVPNLDVIYEKKDGQLIPAYIQNKVGQRVPWKDQGKLTKDFQNPGSFKKGGYARLIQKGPKRYALGSFVGHGDPPKGKRYTNKKRGDFIVGEDGKGYLKVGDKWNPVSQQTYDSFSKELAAKDAQWAQINNEPLPTGISDAQVMEPWTVTDTSLYTPPDTTGNLNPISSMYPRQMKQPRFSSRPNITVANDLDPSFKDFGQIKSNKTNNFAPKLSSMQDENPYGYNEDSGVGEYIGNMRPDSISSLVPDAMSDQQNIDPNTGNKSTISPFDEANDMLDQRAQDAQYDAEMSRQNYSDLFKRIGNRDTAQLITSLGGLGLQDRTETPNLKSPYYLPQKYQKFTAQEIKAQQDAVVGTGIEGIKKMASTGEMNMAANLAPVVYSQLIGNASDTGESLNKYNKEQDQRYYNELGQIRTANDTEMARVQNVERDNNNKFIAESTGKINDYMSARSDRDVDQVKTFEGIERDLTKKIYAVQNQKFDLKFRQMDYEDQMADIETKRADLKAQVEEFSKNQNLSEEQKQQYLDKVEAQIAEIKKQIEIMNALSPKK